MNFFEKSVTLFEASSKPKSEASAEATTLKPPTMSTLPSNASTVLFDVELLVDDIVLLSSRERPSWIKLSRLRLTVASAMPSRLLTPKEIYCIH